MQATVLAGDVGGTKIHFGLYRVSDGAIQPISDRVYATRNYPNLEAAIKDFLDGAGRVSAACFGVPGPVVDDQSQPVNIPWRIAAGSISAFLQGSPVRLLNDLEATAWGTLNLRETDVAVLQPGQERRDRANRAVIAAGTGLGEAGIVATENGWRVVPSEGGHTDFAPRGDEQEQLLHFLAGQFDHVSFERVISGPGLHNIYRFLLSSVSGAEPEWLLAKFRETPDASAVISETGLSGRDDRCAHAIQIFAAIYGAEAANLALKYLALGGVYVCGGIAPKILPVLKGGGFVRGFLDKGRLRPLLEQIPISVALTENVGLLGAAHVAATML
jgi:glucokinase